MKKTLLFSLALATSAGLLASPAKVNMVKSEVQAIDLKSKISNVVRENDNVANLGLNGGRLKAEAVDVKYTKPAGTYFWAPDLIVSNTAYPCIQVPAYTKIDWLNKTTGVDDLSMSIWKASADATEFEMSQDYTVKYNGGYMYYTPILTVNGVDYQKTFTNSSKVYSYFTVAGGIAGFTDANYGFGVFDARDKSLLEYFRSSYFAYPFVDFAVEKWQKTSGLTDGKVTGFSQRIDKPAVPYVLSKVRFAVNLQTSAPTEFQLEVRKMTEDGKIGEVVGVFTKSYEDAVQEIGDDKLPTFTQVDMDFDITGTDPVTGFDTENLLVSDGLFLTVRGFDNNDNVVLMAPFIAGIESNYCQAENDYASFVEVEGKDASGNLVNSYENTANIGYWYDNAHTTSMYCKSYTFALDAEFPYCAVVSDEGEDCDEQTEFYYQADNAGSAKQYLLSASELADDITIASADDEMPDWLTVSATDYNYLPDGGTAGEDEVPLVVLNFTAKALPTAVSGRAAKINVTCNHVTKVFNILQGETGVSAVEADGDVNVTVNSGNFEVSYPANVAEVMVYTVDGKLVKNVELDATGAATIDASNLANGVYVLKFNNNFTTKVVK